MAPLGKSDARQGDSATAHPKQESGIMNAQWEKPPGVGTIHQGDALEVMRGWPDGCVHSVVAHRLGREFVGIDLAGGDKDLGGHTAHDRIQAAKEGRKTEDFIAHREAGQMDSLEEAE